MTKTGFVFHVDPEQVAPYSLGTQDIEVEFSDLKAILTPEWNK
ncbi:hypothetical protein J7J83_01660 [bacterium]|nr:hypothetical protein [bacterium]